MAVAEKAKYIVIDGDTDRSRGLNWSEIWRHRELLYFFSWRDWILRYKQTGLGSLWAVLQPVLSVGVFSVFFGKIGKIPSNGIAYPLFSFSGLIIWIFFSNTVARCSSSIVGNSHLISKVYFPRILLPLAAVCPAFFDFAISALVLVAALFFYQVAPPSFLALLFLPVLLLGVAAFSLGIGLALGALNVRYRDVNNGISFLLQLWMFATPVVYPVSLIAPEHRWLLGLNPMTGYVEGVRSLLFGTPMEGVLLMMSVLMTGGALLAGTLYFARVEKNFADVI
jgi:lipopolysaccharide transport system permease protein